ncbi:MAG: LytTR family DNA-binding domain-containing protein [Salinivirgaceae bacterium]|nr:LytTR family DNA-binding domain-containing protein [Salinivirgaceae bacterium]MDD4746932.1 LytTR family DNA-binding domain-containing protein [Salinivirgaceae bacterium]MDY0280209.1 LytTR family DNA-binding domain-containing protein [Salinivirgaceae bacterium]
MLTAVVIDDEPIAATLLKKTLSMLSDVEVIQTFTEPLKAVDCLEELDPDVVFLDIDMPGIDGLTLAKKINEYNYPPFIIFTTAHSDYMLDALRNQAFDFLIKPIDTKDLSNCLKRIELKKIERIKEQLKDGIPAHRQHLKFYSRAGFIIVKPAEIIYFRAEGSYCEIYTLNEKIVLPHNLGKIEQILPKGYFLRINRSVIINPEYIRSVDKKNHSALIGTPEKSFEVPLTISYLPIIESLFDS